LKPCFSAGRWLLWPPACGRFFADMEPEDTSLQSKEIPLETFFHKIVMIRNNLRVLEQKVNANDKLSEADTARLRFL
jgi:hypothetical protein